MQIKYLFFVILCAFVVNANMEVGLIQKDVDTLQLPRDWGFDFVTAVQCTVPSATYRDCVHHFVFSWGGGGDYRLMVGWYQMGFGMPLGKLNLDSVKSAPADTTMQRLGGYTMDSIPPNALASRVGNVYVMKTGADPRQGNPMYAKIKILKFIVHDTATHSIDMIFLWAANLSGYNDLRTAGLDTFHIDTIPVAVRASSRSINGTLNIRSSGRSVVSLAGNGVVVKGERGVWDFRGKKMRKFPDNNLSSADRPK